MVPVVLVDPVTPVVVVSGSSTVWVAPPVVEFPPVIVPVSVSERVSDPVFVSVNPVFVCPEPSVEVFVVVGTTLVVDATFVVDGTAVVGVNV